MSRLAVAVAIAVIAGLAGGARAQPDAAIADAAPPEADVISGGFFIPDAAIPDAAPPDAAPSPPDAAIPLAELDPAVVVEVSHERTVYAVKVILGLCILVALVWLGGHRRVVELEARLGVSNVAAAGFPFVAAGLIASLPAVGVLTGDVLDRLRPLLHFGLGWLGFLIGAQLDIRVLDRVPRGTGYLILVEALAPFAVTAAACGATMAAFGVSWRDPAFWRDAILLGTAAAMTAPRRFRGFANRTWREGKGIDILLAQLDEIVGVVGLVFLTAFFRDDIGGAWQLPATAWLFVSLGLGVALGVLILAMVRVPVANAEFLAVVLGAVAFASGLAGYLQLSPIVICFVAGALVTNLPCEQRDSIFRILARLERPVHVVFLIVAGAVWNVSDWHGWVLIPVFVLARIGGKWAGIAVGRAAVGGGLPAGFADQRRLVSPMSSLALALVISVDSLSIDRGLPGTITVVIGAAIVSELLVQLTADPAATALGEPRPRPIDSLDEESGPVYRDLDDGAP
jgi:Kef-type K+ transport system membrane component KefB